MVPAKEPRLFHYASRKGRRNRNHGWAAAKAPVSAWRMTSDQAPVLWPFISTPGLPPTGAQMGIDLLSGGTFYADPLGWVLDDSVPVTNPNMFIFGKPGRGKSATVKALLLRMMDFGYRALILGDPKDEYELLCRALRGRAVQDRARPADADQPAGVRPARPAAGTSCHADEAQSRAAIVFGRWLTLVRGLVGSQRIGEHRVPFGPTDEVVVKAALPAPDRLPPRPQPDAGGHHPAAVAAARRSHRRSGRRVPLSSRAGISSTRPGCSATPSASWSPAPSPACSTTTPPSMLTGGPRSNP